MSEEIVHRRGTEAMRFLMIVGMGLLLAGEPVFSKEHFVDEVKVAIAVPDGWKHDAKDDFGYLILAPAGGKASKKIRIHNSGHKANWPLEASRIANAKANKDVLMNDPGYQPIVAEKKVVTESGIPGCRSTIGNPAYLNRFFFQRPDNTYFCVCVYYNGDEKFAKECEEMILGTLRLKE